SGPGPTSTIQVNSTSCWRSGRRRRARFPPSPCGPSTSGSGSWHRRPVLEASTGPLDTVRVGVATGIPEPWGSALDRARADAGDPLAAFIPAHVTLLGPTDVAASSLSSIEAHLAAVAPRFRSF